MLRFEKTVKQYLKAVGREMTAVYENGEEVTFFAVAEQTWKKNKTKFEEKATKIGRAYNEYYYIVCPYDINLCEFGKDDVIFIDSQPYEVERCERVKAGGTVQFYRGIVKKLEEADENVFN